MPVPGDNFEEQESLALQFENGVGGGMWNLFVLSWPDNHWNIRAHLLRSNQVDPGLVDKLWSGVVMAQVESGLGRWEEARDIFNSLPKEFALHILEHKALMMSLPFLEVPEAEIETVIQALEEWPSNDKGFLFDAKGGGMAYGRYGGHFGIHQHLRLYLQTLLNIRLGRPQIAAGYADRLSELEAPDKVTGALNPGSPIGGPGNNCHAKR